jgi:hypothetical protein
MKDSMDVIACRGSVEQCFKDLGKKPISEWMDEWLNDYLIGLINVYLDEKLLRWKNIKIDQMSEINFSKFKMIFRLFNLW